jgi:hypothetical protein
LKFPTVGPSSLRSLPSHQEKRDRVQRQPEPLPSRRKFGQPKGPTKSCHGRTSGINGEDAARAQTPEGRGIKAVAGGDTHHPAEGE